MAYQITAQCVGCGFCVYWCPTKAIKGSRKKVHQIAAEKCIDCGTCGKICGFMAVIDSEGVQASRLKLSDWPKPVWTYEVCNGCNDCIKICPVHCLTTQTTELVEAAGFGKPYLVKPKICVSCGFCSKICEQQAIQLLAL